MKAEWDTPADGDFARFVEQLAARAVVQRREEEDRHGMDVGMAPSAAPQRPPEERPSGERRGDAPVVLSMAPSLAGHRLLKALAMAWGLLLLGLLAGGAAPKTLGFLLALGLWGGYQLRRWALPPGVVGWRQWLETAVRQQQMKQRQSK